MKLSPSIQQLIAALRQLPGVGPKSAQRMAFLLLERNRRAASHLASALNQALEKVVKCPHCRMLCEGGQCELCAHHARDRSQLCVVETPLDVFAIEQSGSYRGLYFVLSGRLSPIEGIGPEQLGFSALSARLSAGEVKELILATSSTVEGEATSHYLLQLAQDAGVNASRIAQGVPIGGELEQVDGHTLSLAFSGRKPFL